MNYLTRSLAISFSHHLELQERKKKKVQDARASTPTPASECPPTSPQDEVLAKALEIVNIARKGMQEELENLQGTCLTLKDEVIAVTARWDLMVEDLGHEHEWIRLLELTLKTHAIPFPQYPFT